MTTYEIERLLRNPAPDEPAILPALILPSAAAGFGGVRIRPRLAGVRTGFVSPRLLFAVLALVAAMVSAIATGAIRLDRLPNPFDSTSGFGARGLTIDYPDDWQVVAAMSPFNDQGGWTTLILSNKGVAGCAPEEVGIETPPVPVQSGDVWVAPDDDQTGAIYGQEDRIFACVVEAPMAPGEIRLVLTKGFAQRIGVGPIEPFDPTDWFGPDAQPGDGAGYAPSDDDGWGHRIDGMPAKLVVETTSIVPGADEVRTWGIYPPDGYSELWFVRATLRGPDLEGLRAAADAIALSVRFDTHPAPLDESTRDVALGRAIDSLDRETRLWRGSDLYGCFPRTPGAAEAMIDDLLHDYGPDGRIAEPVPVTCTTTVERNLLEQWVATLMITWEAGEGYAAGRWGSYISFDANGGPAGSAGSLETPDGFAYPGRIGELPAPLDGPLEIPIGSLVEVLPPGIQTEGPIQAYYANPNETIGDRIASDAQPGIRYGVLGGPISHAGYEWYLVESQHGTSYPPELIWIPSTDGIRPLVRVVDATCPEGHPSVVELLAMQPLERLACFGGDEVVLDPAIAELAADDGNVSEIDGTPDWLARFSLWRLFGAGGPDGLDGSLPIAIAPSLGDAIPTGTWLSVRGHFDDPAAAGCQRTYPAEWGLPSEPHAVQVLQCRELFVVTGIEPRSAP
jgi:hypothetical protein